VILLLLVWYRTYKKNKPVDGMEQHRLHSNQLEEEKKQQQRIEMNEKISADGNSKP